jgi:hypothetical protein
MILPSRRDLIVSIAALSASSAGAAPAPEALGFAAYRNGRRIGQHRLSFEDAGEALIVRIRAEMTVKVGPVTAFRYLHEVTERWRGGQFEALSSRTSSNGKRESVEAQRTPGGVVIRTGTGSVTGPAGALPMTHWNRRIAGAPLFNPQTGKLLALTVRDRGQESVATADGTVLKARRYGFSGDAQIDNWYDGEGVWAALRGRLDDGSTMEYRRL